MSSFASSPNDKLSYDSSKRLHASNASQNESDDYLFWNVMSLKGRHSIAAGQKQRWHSDIIHQHSIPYAVTPAMIIIAAEQQIISNELVMISFSFDGSLRRSRGTWCESNWRITVVSFWGVIELDKKDSLPSNCCCLLNMFYIAMTLCLWSCDTGFSNWVNCIFDDNDYEVYGLAVLSLQLHSYSTRTQLNFFGNISFYNWKKFK